MTSRALPWSNLDPPYTGVFQIPIALLRSGTADDACRDLSYQQCLPISPGLSAARLFARIVGSSECAVSVHRLSNLADGVEHCLSHHLTEKIREVAA